MTPPKTVKKTIKKPTTKKTAKKPSTTKKEKPTKKTAKVVAIKPKNVPVAKKIPKKEKKVVIVPEEALVIPKKRSRNYLNNPDLLVEVALSKKAGKMTNKLATMLLMLCERYATKPNYVNYTYNDDMRGYAMMMICRTWHKFDHTKSNNPFAFYTQCIKHSFIQYLNQEKRQRDIRDELLIDQGMNPSFNYTYEHSGQNEDGEMQDSDSMQFNTAPEDDEIAVGGSIGPATKRESIPTSADIPDIPEPEEELSDDVKVLMSDDE